MTSMELYINNQLCDTDSAQNFSVYLKRRFITPTELNAKDAQKSYSISLPASTTNNAIFGYKNTEEVSGKFNELYDARLSVAGVEVFNGKFKMTGITKSSYKGNLGIPKSQTIKDIFGDKKMNEIEEWTIPFSDFDKSVELHNSANYFDPNYGYISPCIFPFVLYGLPRKKKDSSANQKTLLDNNLALEMDDFPPSINCVHAIRRLFHSLDYQVEGTALDDPRIKNMYMSYRNPENYIMPWNYGLHSFIEIKGSWRNGEATSENYKTIDKGIRAIKQGNGTPADMIFSCDLFYSTNTDIKKENLIDPGNNVEIIKSEYNKRHWTKHIVKIPVSGYYKISLSATLNIPEAEQYGRIKDKENTSVELSTRGDLSSLDDLRYELKVIRENQENPYKLDKIVYDARYHRNNQKADSKSSALAYYPTVTTDSQGRPCQTLFIDLKHNPTLISGISLGEWQGHWNPLDTDKVLSCILTASPIKSWDEALSDIAPASIAINSPKYTMRSKLGEIYETEQIDKHNMQVTDAPDNWARRTGDKKWSGDGEVNSIVWLEKGEKIHLVSTTRAANVPNMGINRWVLTEHMYDFELKIHPYKMDKKWLDENIDPKTGSTIRPIEWNDEKDSFRHENINLAEFLPSEVKIQEWIDEFCKAFNLEVKHKGEKKFEINLKERFGEKGYNILELDNKLNINSERSNSDVGFPSSYDIGFTIDEEERGYVLTKDRGSEVFETGSINESKLSQKSNFSYNWLQNINISQGGSQQKATIPFIFKDEIWTKETDSQEEYEEDMKKRYTNSPQRFWYKGDKSLNLVLDNKKLIKPNQVVETLPGKQAIVLNYKNKPNTILNNFFTVFIDNNNSFTEVECYLSPTEYANIDTCLARLNGDLYYIAEVDSYDPMSKKKAKLKLIRKV